MDEMRWGDPGFQNGDPVRVRITDEKGNQRESIAAIVIAENGDCSLKFHNSDHPPKAGDNLEVIGKAVQA